MEYKVKCEKFDHFGRGICYVDGKVVFVPGFFPSEEALIKINLNKKNYMIGEIVSLIKKSDDRIFCDCPYKDCGCILKEYNYEKTLLYKKHKVLNILSRFGSLSIGDAEIVPCMNNFHYRNKITLKVLNGELGYYKNKSNDLIKIDTCLIAGDKTNEIISILKNEDLSNVSEIIIKDMDDVMIIIHGKMDYSNLKNYCASIYMNNELVFGSKMISNSLLGYKFMVSKDSFFQVNKEVTEKLYSKVSEFSGKGKCALDLYSGTGTIGILLSKNFDNVFGIEINKEAVDCANINKEINGIHNIDFKCGDANKLIKGLTDVDVIVVDPARAGLSKDGISNILDIAPKKVVYVSCNPVTLARDLKFLSDYYVLKNICIFDMFPWTFHCESITVLERR